MYGMKRRAAASAAERLHQQLSADTRARLFESPRRDRKVPVADERDDPAAQVLALEQHEDHHRDHEAGGRKWAHRRSQPTRKPPQRGLLFGGHHERCGGAAARVGPFLEFLLDVTQRLLDFVDRAAT
jgi:hypothetical protein